LKEWVVIHKIKGLYDNGQGLSIRAIARELGISRNTVRKYLAMEEAAIDAAQNDPSRTKRLDEHRDYLIHQLKAYPRLSAVKLARRLRNRVGELPASERSIRRYVQALKQEVAVGQWRYYEPVLDAVPGVQCQVDPGELRGVWVGGQERTLHFVVFVLSCSRLMYVGLSFQPLDTEAFIQLHDEAFRYFGGVTEECVYDQTKLVVIDEQYRELTLNQRFHQYATSAGYRIYACEGYDPESKGKVEAGVKYVKQDALYGECFADEAAVREHLRDWLETVANTRVHGTTGRAPREHFDTDERAQLRPYLVPDSLLRQSCETETRRADKTGLISWRANKYSVPMAWQQAQVSAHECADELHIHDLETRKEIARHTLCREKGRIIKNNNHYRDPAQRIADLESTIAGLLAPDQAAALCRLLKATSPRIYKDQLVGARDLLKAHGPIAPDRLKDLLQHPRLTARQLRQHLEAWQQAQTRGRETTPEYNPERDSQLAPADLSAYAQLGHPSGQEVPHEPA
jgi:transposase